MKNTFYISCPIDTYSGYGARSRDFVKALIKSEKYEVKILPQRWGNTPFGFIKDHKNEWGFLTPHLLNLPNNQLDKQPDIWCQITVPNEFQKVGKYNIGLTAGIETTICAHQWIEGCNRMDLILTSSKHSKSVFENTVYDAKNTQNGQQVKLKLTTPCEVLIEGADLDVYKKIDKKDFKNQELLDHINNIPESFAYLFVGHWMKGQLGEDRKNVGLLIKAFYELYKNKKKKPALILKMSGGGASYMDRYEMQKRINSIRNSVPKSILPNVYLIHGEFNDSEMNELYNHPKIKAMVSLTKGEGFGRPLLEFSLTNKPVIATNWSGQTDFLKSDFSAMMGGQLTKIHPSAQQKDMLIEGSEWFSVNHSEVGRYLNEVFEQYKDWKVKGKRQGYYSRSNFSFAKMEEQLNKLLTDNLPTFAEEVTISLPQFGNKPSLPKLKKV
ncbi:glycosyltransferase [bacterium]|nr:glycosyltransferase [bacterium]|tara:strand:- start:1702 stop:3021 length:1320 start_codon:yes stop_codon:yes gene_type:complete